MIGASALSWSGLLKETTRPDARWGELGRKCGSESFRQTRQGSRAGGGVSGADGVGDEPRTAAGETGGTRPRLEGYVRDLDVFPTGSRKSSNSFK